jgi:hypothetical protein
MKRRNYRSNTHVRSSKLNSKLPLWLSFSRAKVTHMKLHTILTSDKPKQVESLSIEEKIRKQDATNILIRKQLHCWYLVLLERKSLILWTVLGCVATRRPTFSDSNKQERLLLWNAYLTQRGLVLSSCDCDPLILFVVWFQEILWLGFTFWWSW